MTSFTIIGCTAIIAAAIIVASTLATQAWERVRTHAADNWLTAQREHAAAAARTNKQMLNLVRDNIEEESDG